MKRYNYHPEVGGMLISDNGEYVVYSEIKQLEAENEKLKKPMPDEIRCPKELKRIEQLEEHIKELSRMMKKISDMNTKVIEFMYKKTK